MSVNFQQPISPAAKKMMEEYFGTPVAEDGQTFLYNQFPPVMERSAIKAIANEAAQPLTTEFDRQGTIKIVDRVEWILTETGWRKLMEVRADENFRVSDRSDANEVSGTRDGLREETEAKRSHEERGAPSSEQTPNPQ